MQNIDYFNQIVGLVFGQLYKSFPVPIDIDDVGIAKALGAEAIDDTPADWPDGAIRIINLTPLPDGSYARALISSTTRWLRAEGFTQGDGEDGDMNVVLTAKALAVMNASPDSLKQTLGSKLTEAVKSSGTEAGRTAIAETVGQIIGAAAKSFSS